MDRPVCVQSYIELEMKFGFGDVVERIIITFAFSMLHFHMQIR
jgi:hypothetical protein